MHSSFHSDNRKALYARLEPSAVTVMFSGQAPRKTNDEYYHFFADRGFVYLTGIEQAGSILLNSSKGESLYVLPKDLITERWNGRRLSPEQATDISGVQNIRVESSFRKDLNALFQSGADIVYLDLYKHTEDEPDDDSYKLAAYIKERYPHVIIKNLRSHIKALRTIKKPCEIAAMRESQKITSEAITAMMRASKPGMYEYQYKAEFDYILGRHGLLPAFPSIICAGENNFCIHNYSYNGQVKDGDMVLNDVGVSYDNLMNDVSRGWPANGKFNERQRMLYECAYATSEHMFGLIKPGMLMGDVDLTIRKYNFERLRDIGLLDNYDDIGKYMWHAGAHHVGYDVHDVVGVKDDEPIAQGMVFCIDIGIYVEDWGIGFRLEDNCLVTEKGCENLSAVTPRSVKDIESIMTV